MNAFNGINSKMNETIGIKCVRRKQKYPTLCQHYYRNQIYDFPFSAQTFDNLCRCIGENNNFPIMKVVHS